MLGLGVRVKVMVMCRVVRVRVLCLGLRLGFGVPGLGSVYGELWFRELGDKAYGLYRA